MPGHEVRTLHHGFLGQIQADGQITHGCHTQIHGVAVDHSFGRNHDITFAAEGQRPVGARDDGASFITHGHMRCANLQCSRGIANLVGEPNANLTARDVAAHNQTHGLVVQRNQREKKLGIR